MFDNKAIERPRLLARWTLLVLFLCIILNGVLALLVYERAADNSRRSLETITSLQQAIDATRIAQIHSVMQAELAARIRVGIDREQIEPLSLAFAVHEEEARRHIRIANALALRQAGEISQSNLSDLGVSFAMQVGAFDGILADHTALAAIYREEWKRLIDKDALGQPFNSDIWTAEDAFAGKLNEVVERLLDVSIQIRNRTLEANRNELLTTQKIMIGGLLFTLFVAGIAAWMILRGHRRIELLVQILRTEANAGR